jgi:HK97 family phage prohead protease
VSRTDERLAALNRKIAILDLDVQVQRLDAALTAATKAGRGESFVGRLDVEGKALTTGAGLRIAGQAAGLQVDRDDEAFLPGVFAKALKKFLRNPILLWNHKFDSPLGRVTKAEIGGGGELLIEATLDDPEPGTPLADVHRKVASGTIRGLSVGGRFKKKRTSAGWRIWDADIIEISVASAPMEPGSLFTVTGKALDSGDTESNIELLALADKMVTTLENTVRKL